jgi:hypothetical protein
MYICVNKSNNRPKQLNGFCIKQYQKAFIAVWTSERR